uniref:RING-type domain-containing protein n=1 Tax=Cucumis sativus TaxID=3659 RepID=A0A0A0L7Y8_CUCSA
MLLQPGERNRQLQMAMEKLTKPSAYYNCEENDESPSTLSECTICLEDLGERVSCRVFPNCKHIFHTHCIINWLEINQTCPISQPINARTFNLGYKFMLN